MGPESRVIGLQYTSEWLKFSFAFAALTEVRGCGKWGLEACWVCRGEVVRVPGVSYGGVLFCVVFFKSFKFII